MKGRPHFVEPSEPKKFGWDNREEFEEHLNRRFEPFLPLNWWKRPEAKQKGEDE
jgi:hypothetical protein